MHSVQGHRDLMKSHNRVKQMKNGIREIYEFHNKQIKRKTACLIKVHFKAIHSKQ